MSSGSPLPSAPHANRRVRVVAVALIVVALCGVTELAAFAFYRWIILTRAPFLAYVPVQITPEEFEHYRRIRDNFLGWPMAYEHQAYEHPGEPFDASGARPSRAFPEAGDECVTVYGDSFVYASEVEDAAAWADLLAARLGCRVGNFGVGGYGTDQAFLRFSRNTRDAAPVTMLGIYPDDVLRNVNQHRFLLSGVREELYGFKPRFVFENDKLRLIPLPTLTYAEVGPYFADPARLLAHEEFLPDSAYGPVRFHFPFAVSLVRALAKERPRNWLRREPSIKGFLEPGHPTRAMELTVEIGAEFANLCRQRARTCLVVMIPTPSSYHYLLKTGTLTTGAISRQLEQRGVRVLDLTTELMRDLDKGPLCPILTQPGRCQGHFNAEGNRMIAHIVHAYLARESLLPPRAQR